MSANHLADSFWVPRTSVNRPYDMRVEAWDKDLGLDDHLVSASIPLYGVAELFAWSGQESADFPSVNFQGPAKRQ